MIIVFGYLRQSRETKSVAMRSATRHADARGQRAWAAPTRPETRAGRCPPPTRVAARCGGWLATSPASAAAAAAAASSAVGSGRRIRSERGGWDAPGGSGGGLPRERDAQPALGGRGGRRRRRRRRWMIGGAVVGRSAAAAAALQGVLLISNREIPKCLACRKIVFRPSLVPPATVRPSTSS